MSDSRPTSDRFVSWFREAAPYIHAFRGRTFVIYVSGELIMEGGFPLLAQDIALLRSLGIHLVLVHGGRPQIDAALEARNHQSLLVEGERITDDTTLSCVIEANGKIRVEIESTLSIGLPNSPMSGAAIRVASGNFVTARPLGVLRGVDFLHTGRVRKIDAAGIRTLLETGSIVLLSAIGYSLTGETFNMKSQDVAAETAQAIGADKLIYITDIAGLGVRQFSWQEANRFLNEQPELSQGCKDALGPAIESCRRGRVRRAHLIDYRLDGGLLQELFSRDGVGILINQDTYEDVRPARLEDIGGLLELIQPLETQGVLLGRSREALELDIQHYSVIERDGMVVACSALYPHEGHMTEMGCLAVHPDYQKRGYGDRMLQYSEEHAKKRGAKQLYVLTTQATHWFLERGFSLGTISDIPETRRLKTNPDRGSKVFLKILAVEEEN
ncbi:MAG: amino-acid N-acetyltransferase [Gammaproteobacteria bacterium]|nr:amino-acid N-acetyltransferase [Gammaproteobacteria bacterium]